MPRQLRDVLGPSVGDMISHRDLSKGSEILPLKVIQTSGQLKQLESLMLLLQDP